MHTVNYLRARIANAVRRGDHALANELRTELKTALATRYLTDLVASSPPLTAEQRRTLRALLQATP